MDAVQHMSLRQTVRAFLCLALALGPFGDVASGQATQTTGQPAPLPSAAEFPEYDARVLREQQHGFAAKVASTRLTQQRESPEITELVQQGRIDDALRVRYRVPQQRTYQGEGAPGRWVEGGTVVLEKEQGIWTVKGFVDRWIA